MSRVNNSIEMLSDVKGVAIPVLHPVPGASVNATAPTANTAGAAVAINATGLAIVVRLSALTGNCYFKLGTSAVAAPTLTTDPVVVQGTVQDVIVKDTETHIRIISDTASATLHVDKLD